MILAHIYISGDHEKKLRALSLLSLLQNLGKEVFLYQELLLSSKVQDVHLEC
jgi:hypothetical protein